MKGLAGGNVDVVLNSFYKLMSGLDWVYRCSTYLLGHSKKKRARFKLSR